MKRRIYVICQKKNWETGIPQVISDGAGQLEYVFASENGLRKGKHMDRLQKCTLCKADFYDKYCPECSQNLNNTKGDEE